MNFFGPYSAGEGPHLAPISIKLGPHFDEIRTSLQMATVHIPSIDVTLWVCCVFAMFLQLPIYKPLVMMRTLISHYLTVSRRVVDESRSGWD